MSTAIVEEDRGEDEEQRGGADPVDAGLDRAGHAVEAGLGEAQHRDAVDRGDVQPRAADLHEARVDHQVHPGALERPGQSLQAAGRPAGRRGDRDDVDAELGDVAGDLVQVPDHRDAVDRGVPVDRAGGGAGGGDRPAVVRHAAGAGDEVGDTVLGADDQDRRHAGVLAAGGVQDAPDQVAAREDAGPDRRDDPDHPGPQALGLDHEADEGEDQARADEGADEAVELLGALADHLRVPAAHRGHQGQSDPCTDAAVLRGDREVPGAGHDAESGGGRADHEGDPEVGGDHGADEPRAPGPSAGRRADRRVLRGPRSGNDDVPLSPGDPDVGAHVE